MNKAENADHVIVGGGLAGFNTAVAIRKRNSSSRTILVGDEPHLPYDKVPLSKDYLAGRRTRERVFFMTKEFYEQQRIEVMTERRAKKLDLKGHSLKLGDDSELCGPGGN